MNNSRFDGQDRKKLFNFQFTRHQELVRNVYLSKYDYMKLPEGFGDVKEDSLENDIVSNPDDDISDDGFITMKAPLNKQDLQELEELDDLLGDNDPYTLALPVKRTSDTPERACVNVTQEDLEELDQLMDEYLALQ